MAPGIPPGKAIAVAVGNRRRFRHRWRRAFRNRRGLSPPDKVCGAGYARESRSMRGVRFCTAADQIMDTDRVDRLCGDSGCLADASGVRRGKVCEFPWVRDPHLEGGCTPGSSRSRSGGNERSGAFDVKGLPRQLSESAGHNASERRAGPENVCCGSRPSTRKGKATPCEV